MTPESRPPRLHALDNLRALMMWLGIVLHVAVIHVVGDSPLPWRDEQRTRLADLLMAFIHSFRMPVFFILAGFFVAMLLARRGPRGMARQRLARLGLPFALFWPPLYVLCGLAAMVFMHRLVRGSWGLDWALRPRGPNIPNGPGTMHLWFLWMLLWLSVLAAALASVRHQAVTHMWAAAGKLMQRLGAAWWGVALLVLPLVWAGLGYRGGLLAPSGLFVPRLAEWVHNGLFFAFGLALYHQQWELFDLYRRRCADYALAGLPFFVAALALYERRAPAPWIALVYNAATWLWSFALIGLALRVLNRRNAALAYLAESSYWVYLVHFPLTIGFGVLFYGLALPAVLKMALNISATTAICLASYQLAVRSTWVGALLNGRRRAPQPTATLSHVTSS
jgi:fucose 4-O-acetylase-like acetyltransferase